MHTNKIDAAMKLHETFPEATVGQVSAALAGLGPMLAYDEYEKAHELVANELTAREWIRANPHQTLVEVCKIQHGSTPFKAIPQALRMMAHVANSEPSLKSMVGDDTYRNYELARVLRDLAMVIEEGCK